MKNQSNPLPESEAAVTAVKVQFGVQEDARQVILEVLEKIAEPYELGDRKKARLAGELTAALRDAGCLAQSVEQHYNATQTAGLIGRSTKYVGKQAAAGAFGPVMRDDRGWLIPASGIQRWLDARIFSAGQVLPEGEAA